MRNRKYEMESGTREIRPCGPSGQCLHHRKLTHNGMPTMHWLDPLERIWPHLVAGLAFLGALLASIHALLNKRDPRAAVLWLGFIWLMPLLGPMLYLSLGVNR